MSAYQIIMIALSVMSLVVSIFDIKLHKADKFTKK